MTKHLERIGRFILRWEKTSAITGLYILYLVFFLSLDYYQKTRWESGGSYYSLWTTMDEFFPFWAGFIWGYILYYPYCITPLIVIRNKEEFRKAALSFLYIFITVFPIFLAFPVRMELPKYEIYSNSTWAMSVLNSADPGFNVFPSLHVAHAFLVFFLIHRLSRFWGYAVLPVTLLITVSTLYTKQHYFLDIPPGILLGWGGYRLAMIPNGFERAWEFLRNHALRGHPRSA